MQQLIEQVNIWVEAVEFVEGISDEDVEWAHEQLTAVGEKEKVIGVIENPVTRRIYSACVRLRAMFRAEHAHAKLERDKFRRDEGTVKALRYDDMADILRCIAWAQMKDDLNAWLSEAPNNNMGIRRGWKLVDSPPQLPQGMFGLPFAPGAEG